MAAVTPSQACRSCGACCTVQDRGVVAWVSGDEAERLRQLGRHLVRRENLGRALGEADGLATDDRGRCLSLRGAVGIRVRCAVYDDRPEVCRRFQPGGVGCEGYRMDAGLPEFRTVIGLGSAT